MPIDTSMYGNVKPIQIESPLNQLAQVAQLQQAQNTNRLADLTFAQHRRELDSDNALARLLTPGAKPEDVAAGLAAQGYGNKSMAYTKQQQELAKQQADIGKTKADTQESEWKVRKGVNDMIGSAAFAVSQNPTYENAQAVLTQLKQQLPPQFASSLDNLQVPQDPAALKQWATNHYLQSIQTDKILADQTSRRNNDQTTQASTENNKRTVAATIRGQNLTDARAREANNAPEYKQDADGNWVALPKKVAPGATITAAPVMGPDGKPLGAGGKALTESQGNATSFAARMRDASATLDDLEAKGINGSNLRTMAAGNGLTNWMASPEGQQYVQGQRNWVTANLRKESGAAIPDSEMANEIKKYFPQAGDSKEVIAQKRRARAVAEEGMLVQAGPGAKQVAGIVERGSTKTQGSAPKVGTVQDGYRFKGGNPADPKAWEKM